jgi:hypothetical protein
MQPGLDGSLKSSKIKFIMSTDFSFFLLVKVHGHQLTFLHHAAHDFKLLLFPIGMVL